MSGTTPVSGATSQAPEGLTTTTDFVLSPELINYPWDAVSVPQWEFAIKIVFYVIAFLLDIVGNSIVILIVIRNRKMHVTTNVLIVNLAVADIMVGLFCMWVHLGNNLALDYPFGDYVCKGNTFIQVMAVTSSVLTLTVISVERFVAIVFPLRRRWTPHQTAIIMVVTWLMALAVAAPHLMAQKLNEVQWKDRHEVWCAEDWPRVLDESTQRSWSPAKLAYYVISIIIMYIGPILIMAVAYIIIVVKLVFRKAPGSHVSTTAMAQERAKKKVIKMLVVVFLVFTLCWTPQQAMLLWAVLREEVYKKQPSSAPFYIRDLKYAALYVAYLNSALNPILYSGFNENFRKGFIQAFRCLIIRKVNRIGPASGGTSSRSQASILTESIPIEVAGSSLRRPPEQPEAPAVVSAKV